MIPFHEGVPSGRMWGRDPSGKIDQASYFSKNKQNQEDLFALHSKKLDREREKKWEQSKEKRIHFIQEQIQILKSEEDAPYIEVEIEEDEDDFVPPAFIPQGIDLNNNDAPMPDEPTGDEPSAFPFAPLPWSSQMGKVSIVLNSLAVGISLLGIVLIQIIVSENESTAREINHIQKSILETGSKIKEQALEISSKLMRQKN